ncbi:MAG: putative DNA binding domain-containing protein [Candidatus Liptonbacteria bacterium]|nr:putative DNA binding domain-containing protein [Candidatus Liptonbacteria bacterium]
MADSTTIRRSPIVLIRNLVAIEIAAFLVYFLVTGRGDYKYQFYIQFFFAKFLPYEVAKFMFLSGVQLFITVYAFLRWYYETYELSPGALSHSQGVFFKKTETFPLQKSTAVSLSSGPLGNLLHYGSINLKGSNQNSIILRTVSRPQNYLEIIEEFAGRAARGLSERPNLAEIIGQNEDEKLEFKSSLRFDRRTGQINRDLEKAVMKTIVAFLNSKGGYLVIGIDDRHLPLGLHNDYKTLQRKDSDGFENHFTQVFNAMIGPESRHLIKLWFYNLENQDACVIQVALSPRPIYLKQNETERFYVRTGNITTDLKFSEVESYIRSRWPRQ